MTCGVMGGAQCVFLCRSYRQWEELSGVRVQLGVYRGLTRCVFSCGLTNEPCPQLKSHSFAWTPTYTYKSLWEVVCSVFSPLAL